MNMENAGFSRSMNKFSIRDIENLTGIKAHTLRIWESRYGILQPKRTETNIRYYNDIDLKNALRVSLLNNYGYKISAINKMSEGEANRLIAEIDDTAFKEQALVNDLLQYALSMQTEALESTLDLYMQKHGIDKTVERLLFNFLQRIGLMWMTDRLFPAQEHIVSNIITRKLSNAIEQLPRKNLASKPAILLFLPEGEIHDIGLLYMQYLFYKNGRYPIYLGSNTPLKEVLYVCQVKKPRAIYTHITSAAENFDFKTFVGELHKNCPSVKVYISGNMTGRIGFKLPKQFFLVKSLAEARDLASSI